MADRKAFVAEIERLISEGLVLSPEAAEFWEDYKKINDAPKVMTQKGFEVLQAIVDKDFMSAKDVAALIDSTGRSVSGTFRKLVADGFVEKRPGNQITYKITEKGINYITNASASGDDVKRA